MIKLPKIKDNVRQEHFKWALEKVYFKLNEIIEIYPNKKLDFLKENFKELIIGKNLEKIIEEITLIEKNEEISLENDFNFFIHLKERSLGSLKKYECNNIIEEELCHFEKYKGVLTNNVLNLLKDEYENLKRLKNKGSLKEIKEQLKGIQEKTLFLKSFHKKKLAYIFDYKKFSQETKGWGRHKLISNLNITTCPYCNRQYITNYISNNMQERTTADLDHFFSQSTYPYLALSLYNFIPSCAICNRNFKKDMKVYENDEVSMVYPYKENLNAKFHLVNKKDVLLEGANSFNVELIAEDKKDQNFIKTFKLNEVYKTSHNLYVKEMLEVFAKYSDSYFEELKEEFCNKNTRDTIVDEFKAVIKKPYIFKVKENEPLAKLTKDILEEYGIKI